MTFRSGLAGLVLVLSVVGAAAPSAAGNVEPVATLRPSQPGAAFSVVAEAHGVLVVGAGVVPEGTAPEVFAAVGSRWVSGRAAAVLTGADSQTMLATSGDLVVASNASFAPTDPMVYVKPAGGWSGNVPASARLVASTGVQLTETAVAGSIVVALGEDGALYLFSRPAAGWSGTVRETARLIDSKGVTFFYPPIVAGGRIFAAAFNADRIDVFTEPPAGWSGAVTESGEIADQRFPFLVSGTATFGTINPLSFGVNYEEPVPAVFSQIPARPDGPLRLAARLYEATPHSFRNGAHAFSGDVAALSTAELGGSGNPGPFPTEVTVFTRPAGGWAGTLTARSAIKRSLTNFPSGNALALEGRTLFVASPDKVTVYRVTGTEGVAVKAPAVSRATATGLIIRRPTLRFHLRLGPVDPHVTQFELRIPRGLSLVTSRRVLERALGTHRTPGSPLFAATVTNDHGSLAVRPLLPLPRSIDITIGPGGLRETRALARTMRRRQREHRELVLGGRLRTIDSVGTVRASRLTFRVSR